MRYRIIAEVEADDEEDAIEQVGYRMQVHRTASSIASRLPSFSIERIDQEEYD